MNYNHTQKGYLIIYALIGIALLYGFILTQTSFDSIILVTMVLIFLLVGSFASLNVRIDNNYLRIKFGWGIFRKRFKIKEILSAKAVKNHWYYGWGIRLWLWPHMWIYNVSGFDAVEIEMKNGKRFRIGTDESDILEQEIQRFLK